MKERALSMAARLEVQGRIKDMGRPPVKDVEREAAALILELQSRLESLEKDAARYRWLRNETAIVASNFTERIAIAHYEKDEHDCRTLDGHIDTAMQANKGE